MLFKNANGSEYLSKVIAQAVDEMTLEIHKEETSLASQITKGKKKPAAVDGLAL